MVLWVWVEIVQMRHQNVKRKGRVREIRPIYSWVIRKKRCCNLFTQWRDWPPPSSQWRLAALRVTPTPRFCMPHVPLETQFSYTTYASRFIRVDKSIRTQLQVYFFNHWTVNISYSAASCVSCSVCVDCLCMNELQFIFVIPKALTRHSH